MSGLTEKQEFKLRKFCVKMAAKSKNTYPPVYNASNLYDFIKKGLSINPHRETHNS